VRRSPTAQFKAACLACYDSDMIMSFKDGGTEDIFNGENTKAA
jgi:hypothetical protein